MAGKNIAATVEELLGSTVESLGYDLWDVEYVKIGADYHLIITIDKAEGITIEDCERVHRTIDPILDEADPIENSYRLSVSSPGVERELKRDSHFAVSLGERVEVRLFAPYQGSKVLRGTLIAYEGGAVTVALEEENAVFEKGAYSKVQTVYFD